MKVSRDRLKVLTYLYSLIIGSKVFHSLLAKKVKDLCMHSKLKDGRSSLEPRPRKLFETFLKLKSTNIRCVLIVQTLGPHH